MIARRASSLLLRSSSRAVFSRAASQLVMTDVTDGVATITLNEPARMNALTVEMGDQFERAIEELAAKADTFGAAILTGAGDRAFSAGGDLAFLRDRHSDSPSRNAAIMRRFYERFLSVRRLPVPVIAAVNGAAIGAGMCLALACDLRVVASSARLGFTFVGLGLHPGMGSTHYLPTVVGHQTAARLLLTGETVTGEEAVRIGLAVQHVPQEHVLHNAMQLAQRVAANGPVAVRSAVRTLRSSQDRGLDQALWREAEAQADTYAATDLLEGVTAVAEKRPPAFTCREQYGEALKRE